MSHADSGPLMTLLMGTWGVSLGMDKDGCEIEVFQNPKMRIRVPVRSDSPRLSSIIYGSYAYEHLQDGSEIFVQSGHEFMVPPSAVELLCT